MRKVDLQPYEPHRVIVNKNIYIYSRLSPRCEKNFPKSDQRALAINSNPVKRPNTAPATNYHIRPNAMRSSREGSLVLAKTGDVTLDHLQRFASNGKHQIGV